MSRLDKKIDVEKKESSESLNNLTSINGGHIRSRKDQDKRVTYVKPVLQARENKQDLFHKYFRTKLVMLTKLKL